MEAREGQPPRKAWTQSNKSQASLAVPKKRKMSLSSDDEESRSTKWSSLRGLKGIFASRSNNQISELANSPLSAVPPSPEMCAIAAQSTWLEGISLTKFHELLLSSNSQLPSCVAACASFEEKDQVSAALARIFAASQKVAVLVHELVVLSAAESTSAAAITRVLTGSSFFGGVLREYVLSAGSFPRAPVPFDMSVHIQSTDLKDERTLDEISEAFDAVCEWILDAAPHAPHMIVEVAMAIRNALACTITDERDADDITTAWIFSSFLAPRLGFGVKKPHQSIGAPRPIRRQLSRAWLRGDSMENAYEERTFSMMDLMADLVRHIGDGSSFTGVLEVLNGILAPRRQLRAELMATIAEISREFGNETAWAVVVTDAMAERSSGLAAPAGSVIGGVLPANHADWLYGVSPEGEKRGFFPSAYVRGYKTMTLAAPSAYPPAVITNALTRVLDLLLAKAANGKAWYTAAASERDAVEVTRVLPPPGLKRVAPTIK